ncbi:hypothetical protein FRC06_006441 [Ceratobasidium sp. 370]|nr:hypothetical protein FRC06_006441 [Ceratobasidium sp. 370]
MEGDCAGSALSSTTTVTKLDIRKDPIHSHSPLEEAHNDFWGLPSNPLSIYHTGLAWPLPTGPQAQHIPKEARPVCTHAIVPVWHQLGERIYKYLDSHELKWTTIDPVCFAKAGEEPGPLFLWVGIMPGTLSQDDAEDAALHCKEILLEYNITNIKIVFHKSIFTQFATPQLLNHVPSVDPIADICSPFTPALGLQIAPRAFPYFEGTGCLTSVKLYNHKNNSMPCHEVIHLGSTAFQSALQAILDKIDHEDIMIGSYMDKLSGLDIINGQEARTRTQVEFEDRSWSTESQRILGHVLYAPPISVGTGDKQFTEDWALIELNHGRFNWKTFQGNVIHFESKLTAGQFMKKMYPHAETHAKFKHQCGCLMQL